MILLAAKISELSETNWSEQLARFLSLSDPAVVYGLCGALLLGLTCGLLGAFIVLRGMALMGDTLGHAVLPGVAVAFMLVGQKSLLPLMAGAAVAGGLGTASVWLIRRYSRIKEDSAMGLVLATFFALGIVFLTMIQKTGSGSQSGLDHFLFGQAAALGKDDLIMLGVIAVLVVGVVASFLKELVVTSFDPTFAASIGLSVDGWNAVLMGLVTLAVVSALPAVGVVLVSAMLITPAAAAQLLATRMVPMILWSAALGMASGALGALLSFLTPGMPTGPCMVLAATLFFSAAYLFSPSRGLVLRALKRHQQRRKTERENLVKAIYRALEDQPGTRALSLRELAAIRRDSPSAMRTRLGRIPGLVRVDKDSVELTPEGRQLAERVVRNHRLWEVFLTRQVDIAQDHVHRDAEEIEHILGPEEVARLEEMLDQPEVDPHGRRIPR